MTNGVSHLRMNLRVPSIMCNACVAPVKAAFSRVNGLDSIEINHEMKAVDCRYDMSLLQENNRQAIFDIPLPTVATVTPYLEAILKAIDEQLDEVGHEPATLQAVAVPEKPKAVQEHPPVAPASVAPNPTTENSTKSAPSCPIAKAGNEVKQSASPVERSSSAERQKEQRLLKKFKPSKPAPPPTFSEILMKHPAMKTLQAATMILMVPMIPIMLSAIYVELTRTFKKPTQMPGM